MNQLTFDKFLDEDELAELEKEIKSEPITRNKLLIQLALETGARASELLKLTKKDLVEGKIKGEYVRAVKIRGIKGSRDRQVPISRKLYEGLKDLEGVKLFDITYTRLYQIWRAMAPRRAGGKRGKTFHCLRHTCAVQLYREKKDVKLVQNLLGHVDLKNTMIYVDFVYSQEELHKRLKR